MKKLSKQQVTERGDILSLLKTRHTDVVQASIVFNLQMEEAFRAFDKSVEAYNEAVDAAETFCGEVVAQMEEYYDERSESWQEGETGEAYSQWKDDWEGLDFEHLEVAPPEPLDFSEEPESIIEEFENLDVELPM